MTITEAERVRTAPAKGSSNSTGWRLNVLGPVELCYDGQPVHVDGITRTLLVLLARAAGDEVSTASIIAGIWGSSPPEDAESVVASHVSRLRKALTEVAPDVDPTTVVQALPSGYRLHITSPNVDVATFERLVAEGRRALAVRQPRLALDRFDAALAMWRGAAYEDVQDQSLARAEAARLDELRLAAIESRVEAILAVHAPSAPESLVAELDTLIATHWHRERLWIQLMTALYRLGRRSEALAAYRQAETRLAENLNAAPGPELQAIEQAVRDSDSALLGTPLEPTSVPAELQRAQHHACVGRHQELAWLEAALDLAATRRAQGRVIIGSPGMGKTRLVAEVAARAAARGAVIHYHKACVGDLVAEPDRLSLHVIDDLDRASYEEVEAVISFLQSNVDRPLTVLLTCRDPVRVGDLASLPKLVLTGLEDDAIAEIVRIYAPAVTDAAAVSAMVNAGRVPARVHRLACEWAFGRAGRRIDRAVESAAEPKRWLDSVRDEVVGGVLDLAHVRMKARVLRPVVREISVPYKGLRGYERSDAEIFCGRDRLVAELVARLVTEPVLAIVGTAGCGKSSLVRAGLLPALANGVLPDSAQWQQVVVTPAAAGSLAEHLPESNDEPTLLVVDQFEEVFTELSEAKRQDFVSTLLRILPSTRIVLTLRSEFYCRAVEYPELARVLAANTVLVPPMSTEELREAIERPASLAGAAFEDGLVDSIVADAQQYPGDLARLSTALLALWESGSLTAYGYRATGRVARAIERYAERAYASLETEGQRRAGRAILVRLAGGRTRVERLLDGPDAAAAMETLTGHGIVLIDSGLARLAHETLATEWPRLRGWLDELAAERALREHLDRAATAWVDSGGGRKGLYSGARLAAALEWAAKHPDELDEVHTAFLTASRQALLADEANRRRRVTVLWQWLAAMTAGFVAAAAVATLALVQVNRLDAEHQRSDAARLGAQALVERDLRLGILLAAAATRLDPAATGPLGELLRKHPELMSITGDGVTAVAVSPDGRRLATGTVDGTITVVSTDISSAVRTLTGPGRIDGLTFTPDGRRLVSWGETGGIAVWDTAAGLAMGPPFGQVPRGVTGGLLADGVTLVLSSEKATVAWNIEARTPSTAYELPARPATSIVVSPGGRRIAWGTSTGTLVVDPVAQTTRPVVGALRPAALSQDGRVLLTINGSSVEVWDVGSGRRTAEARRHVSPVLAAAWSADGRRFASVDEAGLVVVWDTARVEPVHVLTGSERPVRTVAFSADGRTLYTVGDDAVLLTWDLSGTRGAGAKLADTSPVDLACRIAGRDMTEQEWRRYLPDRDYQRVCR